MVTNTENSATSNTAAIQPCICIDSTDREETETLLGVKTEAEKHLKTVILPYWEKLRDSKYGGYYGYVDYNLTVNKEAFKGCILNSRILWFFSNAVTVLRDNTLLEYADTAYQFMKNHCIDRKNGGVYWSVTNDGRIYDGTKHTYNQAFAVYALSAYYEASKKSEALSHAFSLIRLIETKCKDDYGYLEAFTVDFMPESNEKLSENGVMAEKTMNTLLHVLEAYTECYRVLCAEEENTERTYPNGALCASERNEMKTLLFHALIQMYETVKNHIYNPIKKRQEVFFDRTFHTLIDLHSYGHDIETAWLLDRSVEIVSAGDKNGVHRELFSALSKITKALTQTIYETAYAGHSLLNECDKGKVNTCRIWWVQAEAVLGFVNGYAKQPEKKEYLSAAYDIFTYIQTKLTDSRLGGEWFLKLDENGKPDESDPITEQWKCPYHNGRMCFELIKLKLGKETI